MKYLQYLLKSEDHARPPNSCEMIAAVKKLKNSEAPGEDDLPTKICKHCGNHL